MTPDSISIFKSSDVKSYFGSLEVLVTPGGKSNVNLANDSKNRSPNNITSSTHIIMMFPSAPRTIDLSRDVSYDNNGNTQITPDGFFIYKYTSPLEVPIDFSVSIYDRDMCPDGVNSLFLAASFLQSLALPMDVGNIADTNIATLTEKPRTEKGVQKSQIENTLFAGTMDSNAIIEQSFAGTLPVVFPAPCVLRLMGCGAGGRGVELHGFIKAVKTSFKAPFLTALADSSASGSNYYNLPSSVDYSFTFVNSPSYTNNLAQMDFRLNLYAKDVFQTLYARSMQKGAQSGAYSSYNVLS